jgi:hypothetical protein
MPFVPIQLPPGVVRGSTAYDSPDRWYESSLVRWHGGIAQPVGGWQRLSSTGFTKPIRKINCWRSSASQRFILLGTTDKVYTDDSGTWVDITPPGMQPLSAAGAFGYGVGDYGEEDYGDARANPTNLYTSFAFYTFANWGEDVVFTNSSDGKLYYYDVTNPTTDAIQIGKYTISSISRTSNVTTVDTSTSHNLTSGESVTIAGVSDNTFNGTFTVTVVDSNTFTYNNTGTNGSSSGGTVVDNTVPASNRAVIVTDERHVMSMGTGGNPRRLGWSSREDYTDWNFSSTTNTAGYLDLETSTPLLTAIKVREGVLVFSETEVFLARYIGSPFIYSAEYLGSSSILHPNMIATFDGKAMWFDQSGFMVYEGGSMRPVQCPVLDFFKSDIDPDYGSAVSHGSENGIFDEVWFFYPSTGQTECDKYVIFNYNEGWWTTGSLSRTAAFPSGANKYPLMAGVDNNLYAHEDGWTDAGDSRVGDVWVETGALSIGQGDRGWEVRQMLPATGFGYDTLKVTVYGRQAPDGSERTFGPYTPRSNGYMDMRVSARDIRVRFEATEDGDWGIGKMRLEVAPGAGR